AWYLSCMKLTGIGRLDMLFVAAPLWVLLLCMAAYYEIGAGIFGRFDAGNRRSLLFLLFFTLVTLCGNAAYMNTSYGLLHYAYEETTLFASVLLPCVFAVLLTAGRNIGRRRR
ncbi:MAG: hypothetical protein J6P60_00690, partial [Lachnospiraceae bacterium]|nr:hypothetical protein [Lachnospiraceae bacterium]